MNSLNTQPRSLSGEILYLAGNVGCTVVAATLISSPVTIGGAALFGATAYFLNKPIENLCNKIFNTNSKMSSSVSKVASLIASFAATAGLSACVASLFGVKLTFKAALILSLASGGVGLAVVAGILSIAALVIFIKFYNNPQLIRIEFNNFTDKIKNF